MNPPGDASGTSVQRKVAIFVTREHRGEQQLLVFWHAASGLQIPAGTVEPGESYDHAAAREVTEETGLAELEPVSRLGGQTLRVGDGRGFVLESEPLRTRPDGPETPWRPPRSMVEVVDRVGDWVRVIYSEHDLDAPPERPLLIARLEGWLPAGCITERQQREFFHFRCPYPTADSWMQQAEPEHRFELRWQNLDPAPDLIDGQAQWLAGYLDPLRRP